MLSTAKERQLKIVNRLKVEQFMRIIDLVEFVNYSEATVKRDLVELEKRRTCETNKRRRNDYR